MKTTIKLKLGIASLLVAAMMVSCNNPRNNRADNDDADTTELMMERPDRTENNLSWDRDREHLHSRLDNLNTNDPDFHSRLSTELDTLDYYMQDRDYGTDNDARAWRDSIRANNNELRAKLERWSNRTGENLDELGDDIKREYNELKESLRDDNNR